MGVWYPSPVEGLLLLVGSGLFLLILGLVPLFPGYQEAKALDPTPRSSYRISTFCGLLFIIWGVGQFVGWPLWVRDMLLWIGGGACVLAVIPDIMQWLRRLLQR